MKRFYRDAAVEPVGTAFRVCLDGRPVRTPGKSLLVLPGRALAEAIAEEWVRQDKKIRPETMPLMRLACTGIDRVMPRRQSVIDEIAGYAASDLTCYRAEAPPELVARQAAAWQPLLDWAAERYDAPLRATAGVMPVAQPAGALAALKLAVAQHDDLALAALHSLTTGCGSLVIALALVEGRLDLAGAWATAQLDESYQTEQWGEDEEAAQRRTAVKRDLQTAHRFLGLLAEAAPDTVH